MQLTKNFNLKEFEVAHTKWFGMRKFINQIPDEYMPNIKLLAENLQVLRDFIDEPITITSAYRSPEYNLKVGGAKFSQHLQGKAADIKVKGLTSLDVYNIIEDLIESGKMKQGGLGVYRTFTHYDIRGNKARW